MSGTTRTSADLEPRRKRILFRAWHRGIREMDLIMGRFADAEIGAMSDAELAEFERLIEVPDRDLYLLAHRRGRDAVELRHGRLPPAEELPHPRRPDPS